MNSTSISKGWYARTFNMLRWLIIDNTLPMGGSKSEEVISAQVRAMYDHDVYVHWQHSNNIQIHDQSYKSSFYRIMLQNPCPVIIDRAEPEKINNCEAIMERVVVQGMTVAFTRHFENMKKIE